MASVETFDCFIKVINFNIFDCTIRATCYNLTVLIKFFDFDLPDGLEICPCGSTASSVANYLFYCKKFAVACDGLHVMDPRIMPVMEIIEH